MEPDVPAQVTKALVNIDAKILSLAYKDLAQPGVQQVGKALSTVLGLGNTVLLPLKLVNEKAQLWFVNHMESYRKSLEQVPEELVAEVPPEIGVPILEKLEKTTNESLSALYINLLAGASVVATAGSAHPRYVQIIESLAPDEVRILDYMWKETPHLELPFIKVTARRYSEENQPSEPIEFTTILKEVTKLETSDYLAFPKNARLYLNNLIALGLVQKEVEDRTLADRTDYDFLRDHYEQEIDYNVKAFASVHKMPTVYSLIQQSYYQLTDLGVNFLRICKPKDESIITRPTSGRHSAPSTRGRHCHIFKARDEHYYTRIESAPGSEQFDYYGPFETKQATLNYISKVQDVKGEFYLDDSGRWPVPLILHRVAEQDIDPVMGENLT